MSCRHLHADGTCRRFPPVMVARGGSYAVEWPKPPADCRCGEFAAARKRARADADKER